MWPDFVRFALGRTEVDGENVFINVMEADLSPDSTRLGNTKVR